MHRSKWFLCASAAAFLVMLGCNKSSAARFVLTGSSTCQPVLQEVAAKLEQRDPSMKFQVEAGGSGRGITDAKTKKAQAGMASRDLTAAEKEGLTVVPFARDGVTIVVHGNRDLKALTSDQVKAIYTGKINNWKDLGGPDQKITVLNKAEGRATLEVFLQKFQLKNSDIKADVVVGDNAQCVRLVTGDEFAIGYLSIGEALRAVERKEPLRLLDLDGVAATLPNVRDGSFPLGRSLYLLFPGEIDAQGQRIVDFLGSKEGSDLLYAQGFVPLSGT
ncbi:MAG: phosphate ABC transporter substrate-binding protein [Planctomycetota bacterium]